MSDSRPKAAALRQQAAESAPAGVASPVPAGVPRPGAGSRTPPANAGTVAVILLAGRSLRTWPMTAELPKPLLPLWGRPLTERVLEQLQGVVETAILVVGYRKERILAHYGDRFGSIRLVPVEQTSPRGTADALRAAAPFVEDRALVINGDDYYHHDDLERAAARRCAILVKEATDPWNRATVSVTPDDRLIQVVEKPPQARPGELSSIGAYSLAREDLAHLGEVGESVRGELELPDLIRILIRTRGVEVVRSRRPWLPLTYAWDLIGRVVPLFEGAGEGAAALGLETTAPRPNHQGPVFLAEGARIHPEARIEGPVALGEGAVVEAGAVVRRAVLLAGARIGEGAFVEDSVLGAGAVIGRRAELRSGPVERIRVLDHEARVGVPRVGACLGDRARIPSGAVVSPGTLVEPGEAGESEVQVLGFTPRTPHAKPA